LSQKSLPVLNKVNTSMIWYSSYYYKHYKWLSAQYIYLLYFLNKLFIYLDFMYSKILWFSVSSIYFYSNEKNRIKIKFKKTRFFYPTTAYLVNLKSGLIIFNFYYKTTLSQFKGLDREPYEMLPHNRKELDFSLTNRMFYN